MVSEGLRSPKVSESICRRTGYVWEHLWDWSRGPVLGPWSGRGRKRPKFPIFWDLKKSFFISINQVMKMTFF